MPEPTLKSISESLLTMKIGIDAHHLGGRRTGVETYVRSLVRHLSLLDSNGQTYLLYLNNSHGLMASGTQAGFSTRQIPTTNSHFRFGVFYPLESWRRAFDIFHGQITLPPVLRTPSVLTVHDLSFERFPQFFHSGVRNFMKFAVPWSCRRTDHIITVSEFSKRDLVEIYRLDPKRITVTYEGAAEGYKPLDVELTRTQLRDWYGIPTPFILYVGNLEPRKNLSRLIEAFTELKRKELIPHKLVIVGQKAWLSSGFFESIRKNSLLPEVVVTGYLPSSDLPAFYNAASLLVYPSLFEGFGLPVVEAMACGTPVITSAGSALEEVAGGAAELVDPWSVSSIATAIERVANSPQIQEQLRHAGLARAARFSFRQMAEQTRAVYHRVGGE